MEALASLGSSVPLPAFPIVMSATLAVRLGNGYGVSNGAQAAAAIDEDLDGFMHLWALNRGILLTPFHNMALFSPHHTEADVDLHTRVFGDAVAALVGATA